MSFYKEVPGRQTTLESTLKFDTTPTAGSTNPVTSGGVAEAIDSVVPQNSYTALAGNTVIPLKVDANGKLTNNGVSLTATGECAWAEGGGTKATGFRSHAEGSNTTASSNFAHSEGAATEASGYQSHAEGYGTKASGSSAHAEGTSTEATGPRSHAGGSNSKAAGTDSFVHGSNLITSSVSCFVVGQYNVDENALFIVGGGTANDNRQNFFKINKNGHMWANADGAFVDVTASLDNTDAGNEITETPPRAEYTVGNYYFILGQLCKCTAYSASSATFEISSLLAALNSLNT